MDLGSLRAIFPPCGERVFTRRLEGENEDNIPAERKSKGERKNEGER